MIIPRFITCLLYNIVPHTYTKAVNKIIYSYPFHWVIHFNIVIQFSVMLFSLYDLQTAEQKQHHWIGTSILELVLRKSLSPGLLVPEIPEWPIPGPCALTYLFFFFQGCCCTCFFFFPAPLYSYTRLYLWLLSSPTAGLMSYWFAPATVSSLVHFP